MKMTPSQKQTEVSREWLIVDAADVPLGRLSTLVATRLRGKHKPTFTPHTDAGDHVIVINADKVRLTGRKFFQNKFFWHTGYPGGIKSETAEETLTGKHPQRLVERGIKRMMPKTKQGREMFKRLRVYTGEEHPHTAQSPKALDAKKAS